MLKIDLSKPVRGWGMNGGQIVGLVIFCLGLICLVIFGTNVQQNTSFFIPGVVLSGGGFIIMYIYRDK